MKKITFNTLPEAIAVLIDRVEKIEKILSKRTSQLKTKSVSDKKSKAKKQEVPAGLLSVKEAGKYLKMSLVNLYSYVKNKKVPFEKRGRRLYFSKTALENWNKSRNQKTSSDTITIKDAERLFKVPASTIYYKIKTQNVNPVVKRGNKLLYSKRELINAFGVSSKRGRKPSKSVKPLKTAKQAKPSNEKAEKPAKTLKAKTAVKASKITKKAKPGRKAKPVIKTAAKSTAKPVAKPAAKPAAKPGKTSKPAKPAKLQKKSKPAKPAKISLPKPQVTPAPEAGPQSEGVPPTLPTPQSNNETKE